MTFEQMQYVVAVYKYGTISQAAQMLNISHPSISRAITNLELELGIHIFVRSRSGTRPTIEGEQVIHLALMVRTGQLDQQAIASYPSLWQKAARQAPVSDFNALLTAVFETRRRKAGQVNWQSNIDHLMMRLLEEHTKWQQSLA